MFKNEELASALFHFIVGIAAQLLIMWCFLIPFGGHASTWFGASVVILYVFAREQAQEERKMAKALKVTQFDLYRHHWKDALKTYCPLTWGRGNQLDFYFPGVAVIIIGIIATWHYTFKG